MGALDENFSTNALQVESHLNLGRNDTFRVLIDFAARTEHKDADMVPSSEFRRVVVMSSQLHMPCHLSNSKAKTKSKP